MHIVSCVFRIVLYDSTILKTRYTALRSHQTGTYSESARNSLMGDDFTDSTNLLEISFTPGILFRSSNETAFGNKLKIAFILLR